MVMKIRKRKKLPKGAVLVDKILAPETKRLLAARHEAAHVIVAHAQGVEVGRTTLDPAEAVAENPLYDAMSGHALGTPLENARIAIAGRIQEAEDLETLGLEASDALYEGGVHADSQHFRQWLFTAAGSEAKAKELVEPVMRETIDMLNARNDTFAALAKALLERGALDEPAILAILGTYPEVSPETVAERERTHIAVKSTGGHPWTATPVQPLDASGVGARAPGPVTLRQQPSPQRK